MDDNEFLHSAKQSGFETETGAFGSISNEIESNNSHPASTSLSRGSVFPEKVDSRTLFEHRVISFFKNKMFHSFKTRSLELERQISQFRGKSRKNDPEHGDVERKDIASIPVDRYFDALQGPELESLRPYEQLVLPKDETWPFLLRYPISSFSICMGVSSQALMWKALATSPSTEFLHISLKISLFLWCISAALIAFVSFVYLLKLILYFEAVRREYFHPVRVSYFFAPSLSLIFLALGAPPSVFEHLPQVLWYILMTPILILELKIYGQWMLGGQRKLSKIANPSNHISIMGNFVGAFLGSSMGLKEGPIFFFAVGLAHYLVLFVTLYQGLPTTATLPKDLHPVYFLFVAAPGVASNALAEIQGSFDLGSKIAYFVALFLYISLAVRVNFFRGFKFSLAWWAYTTPMTSAAIATVHYSNAVTVVHTKVLVVMLCVVATLAFAALLITTIFHGFVLGNLFPNDIAIAITQIKPKHDHRNKHQHRFHGRKWFHLKKRISPHEESENHLSLDQHDIEAYPTGDSPHNICISYRYIGLQSSKKNLCRLNHSLERHFL